MQNLRALRQRIKSVQSTQKITRAMQMVAGAKLRRSQEELVAFKPYALRLDEMTTRFLAAHPVLRHPLLGDPAVIARTATQSKAKGRQDEAISEIASSAFGGLAMTTTAPLGLVVITSDTGLCGTYNERVVALAEGFLKENPSAHVVAIGRKGNRALVRRGIPRIKEILDWGGRLDPDRMMSLFDWMESYYLESKVSAWWIATTQFFSAVRWKPAVERFLPMERAASQGLPEKVILEPNRDALAAELLRRTVVARFRRILLEAFTSEHSARMIAMKNATDNASEMIDHLTLVRNKVRQAAITKELIEVVSGAEALK